MNEDVRKLRITSSMTLEQAMLEVRQYLAARNTTAGDQVSSAGRDRTADVRSAQFSMQAAMASRLSEIAARLGEIEPHSRFGALGVFLKRVVHAAIGWYSRPAHEFDRAAIELLQQIRQDMIGLQRQLFALQERVTSSLAVAPATSASALLTQPVQDRGGDSQQREALLLMIELFKNISALQTFRRTLRDDDPELLRQIGDLLDKIEAESETLRAALARSLEAGKQ